MAEGKAPPLPSAAPPSLPALPSLPPPELISGPSPPPPKPSPPSSSASASASQRFVASPPNGPKVRPLLTATPPPPSRKPTAVNTVTATTETNNNNDISHSPKSASAPPLPSVLPPRSPTHSHSRNNSHHDENDKGDKEREKEAKSEPPTPTRRAPLTKEEGSNGGEVKTEPHTPTRRVIPKPPQGGGGGGVHLGARADFATLKGQVANQLSRNLASNGGLSKISDNRINMKASEFKLQIGGKINADQRQKMESMRKRLIEEMLETEITYVQGLQVLTNLYRIPLLKTDILPKQQVDKLFSNIESLLELNERFLSELRLVVENPHSQCLGPLFISHAPLFRIYKIFVNNHEAAATQLSKLLGERGGVQRFKDFHKECEQKPEAQGLSLASFLIMPIQRIPRYKLLLVEIIKNTPPDHPDTQLVQAHDELRDIAMEINDSIKEIENRTKILALQTICDTQLFVPNRWFIREGDLMKKCRAGDKKFMYFLFNDMLMYGTKLPLNNKCKISHKIPIDQSFLLKDAKDIPFGWQLINSLKSFIVYAKDEQEKVAWVNDINNCIVKYQESLKGRRNAAGGVEGANVVVDVKPIWESNANSDFCPLCTKKFSTFFRRHHCRRCGQLCCSECSRFSVEKKGERFCVKCFTEAGYQEEEQDQQDLDRASGGVGGKHRRNGSGSLDFDNTNISRRSVNVENLGPSVSTKIMNKHMTSEESGIDEGVEGVDRDSNNEIEEKRKREDSSKKELASLSTKFTAKIQRFGAVKATVGPHFPGCFKEGFLMKKGEKLNNWKRRYFVLQNGKLMYFENPETKKLGGQMEVGRSSAFGIRGSASSLTFWLCPVGNGQVFELEADDVATRDAWLEAFRQFITQSSGQTSVSSAVNTNVADELISKMSVILTPKRPPGHPIKPPPSDELILGSIADSDDKCYDLGWKQLIDDSGTPFYWHETTGVSVWDVPIDYKAGN